MIGSVSTTQNFRDTLRYVARETSERIYANFAAGILGDERGIDYVADAMESEASWSTRVEKPCYHFSLSPAPDDELTDSDWRNLTEEFLEGMDLGDRQAVGWLHHDAEYPDGSTRTHLHLVVNRVDMLAGAASTSWDYRRVDEVIRSIEENYQLSRVASAEEVQVRRDSQGQYHRLQSEQAEYENPDHPRTEPPEPSIKIQIQDALDEAMERSPSVEKIPAYLERQGIETRQNSRGWSFDKGGVHFSGSQLGKRYSRPSVEKTMAQNSLNMQEVMRQSSEADAEVDEQQQAQAERQAQAEQREQQQQAQQVQRSGQRLMEKTGDVDGLTFIGAGMAAAGALAERFNEQLGAARDSAQDGQEQQQVKQLEGIGDRTSALENQLLPQAEGEEVIDAEIIQNQVEGSQAQEVEGVDQPQLEAASPIENSIGIAAQRVTLLEREMGIEPSAGQRGPVDDEIAQLDQRLGVVEEAAQQRSLPATEQDSLPAVTAVGTQALDEDAGARTAESLENFTLARTEFKGQIEPQPYDSSLGTVTLTREGFQDRDQRLTVTDENFGTVFEARKDGLSGEWEPEINELDQGETDTVASLPQSAEEYGQYKRGQQLIGALQDMPQTSQQFEGDRGEINWSGEDDGQGFSYKLGIEKQGDGSQRVTGNDAASGDQVFSATIQPRDGQVFVEQNDIPEGQSQQISSQKDRELKLPELQREGPTLGAQPQRSQQRELEL